jgi:anti-sigma-K factor RskA
MTCAEFEVILSDYVDGAVSVEQRREVEAHADNCPGCRELLRDVFQAVAFLESAERPAPPAELITRLVYHAPKGRVRGELERQSWLRKLFSRWLQPALQPRMAMSMAMTILSFAMLGKCTGIRLQQITPADLNPVVLWNNLEDKSLRTWDRTVKYYENLRLVFEMETRLKEMREQQDEAPGGKTPSQNGAGRSGTSPSGNSGGSRQ